VATCHGPIRLVRGNWLGLAPEQTPPQGKLIEKPCERPTAKQTARHERTPPSKIATRAKKPVSPRTDPDREEGKNERGIDDDADDAERPGVHALP
jgi:hypothetical protein